MQSKVSPWGLAALLLGSVGLLLASLVRIPWPTVTLAACGAVAALLGIPFARGVHQKQHRLWLAFGGVLSALVLGVALVRPGLLNHYWVINFPVPESDPHPMVVVPHEKPRDPGQPLAESDWADAGKEAIRQDDLLMRVDSAKSGRLPEKGLTPYLLVNFKLTQIRPERNNAFSGFQGVQQRPVLKDESGHTYAFVGFRPRNPFGTVFDTSLKLDLLLIFELPSGVLGSFTLEVPASAWGRRGTCRFRIASILHESNPDLAKLIGQHKKLLRTPPSQPPDPSLGRAVFTKNCQECHTLFGFGGKIGPELTESKTSDGRVKRTDLDFLLTSIIDPSAEIAKEYQPSIILTSAGLVIHGIIKEAAEKTITVQTHPKALVVAKDDIEEIRESKVSLMPTDLLKDMEEHHLRSLIAYVSGPGQVPLLATDANAVAFYGGQDLRYWHGAAAGWRLEQGELVAPGKQAILTSDLLLTQDFQVSLQFHPGKAGKGAILFRAEGKDSAAVRVEFSAGGRLELGGNVSGSNVVQPESWNKLELMVRGKRLEVRLNGKEDATRANAEIPRRGVVALEDMGHVIRYRHLDVRLLTAPKE